MLLTNYHTHTLFCDGKDEPEAYIDEALSQNLKAIGFSAHAPMPFHCQWTLPPEKYANYLEKIQTLKKKHADQIEIYCGLELDYIPSKHTQITNLAQPYKLDYFIGSIHFIDQLNDGTLWCIDGSNEDFRKGWLEIFHGDSHAIIQKYFEYTRQMVREMKPPIIGHLDKIKMQHRPDLLLDEMNPYYQKEVMQTLEEIAASKCVVEVNTRGMYKRNVADLYPSTWVLNEMAKMRIPVTINSDAHRANEITLFYNIAREKLLASGYKTTSHLSKGGWYETDL